MAMQGDAFYLPLRGTGFAVEDVALIEIVIGPLRKTYPGDVLYDAENGLFLFPLTQEETGRQSGPVMGQARIKFKNAQGVVGTVFCAGDFQNSMVRTVL